MAPALELHSPLSSDSPGGAGFQPAAKPLLLHWKHWKAPVEAGLKPAPQGYRFYLPFASTTRLNHSLARQKFSNTTARLRRGSVPLTGQ